MPGTDTELKIQLESCSHSHRRHCNAPGVFTHVKHSAHDAGWISRSFASSAMRYVKRAWTNQKCLWWFVPAVLSYPMPVQLLHLRNNLTRAEEKLHFMQRP